MKLTAGIPGVSIGIDDGRERKLVLRPSVGRAMYLVLQCDYRLTTKAGMKVTCCAHND